MASLEFLTAVGVNGAATNAPVEGDTFRFSNIIAGAAPADEIDALLTVVNINNGARIRTLDNNDNNPSAFRPFIEKVATTDNDPTLPGASIEFQIAFVQPGTTIPAIVPEFNVTLSDIDGTSTQQEFADLAGFQSFTTLGGGNSLITTSDSPVTPGVTRFSGASTNLEEFDPPGSEQINTQIAVSAQYLNANVFNFTLGLTNPNDSDTLGARQFSLNFDETLVDQFIPPTTSIVNNAPPLAAMTWPLRRWIPRSLLTFWQTTQTLRTARRQRVASSKSTVAQPL